MTETVQARGVTQHFVHRAVERMGCTPDEAVHIGQGILWALQNERWDLIEFVCRVSRDGMRVFRFRYTPTGRSWFAMVDTRRAVCVTVLPSGFVIPRQGKHRLKLKEEDL